MAARSLINSKQMEITLDRLCCQLIENHNLFEDAVIIGLQPRGVFLAQRLEKRLRNILNKDYISTGKLDVTFFRDDFRKHSDPLIPNSTDIDFLVEDKNVILVDDVLFSGRTIRAGLDAILAFGRPKKVELLVLIDRRYSRHLPIEPDYVGAAVDTITSEKVKVEWMETDGADNVWLVSKT